MPEYTAPTTPPSLPEDPIAVESQPIIASDVTLSDVALNDRQTGPGDADRVKRLDIVQFVIFHNHSLTQSELSHSEVQKNLSLRSIDPVCSNQSLAFYHTLH